MSLTSIHDVGRALQARLRAQGCPLDVVFGPELQTATWGRERIVIEHDVDAKDSFGAPRGLHVNAKHRYTAEDVYRATIYVQSKASGATTFEHRQRAKLVREALLTALEFVAATNKNRFTPTSGGFITPQALAAAELPGGAVYELAFTYAMPVRAVTFTGEARPEGLLVGMTNQTVVSRSGQADDDDDPNTPHATAEIACGA